MSRAFVKEDDGGTPEAQVDLPMSEHPNFVTPAGLQMLRDRVEEFEEERARLKEHEADLATQSHLPRVEQELRYWEERLRSEEHTSELQSLMRSPYAVYCLKHKT